MGGPQSVLVSLLRLVVIKEEMITMRFDMQWISGLALAVIAMVGLSCAHGNTGKKDATLSQADHESMVSQYRKGIEESRKIVVAKVNGADITMYDLINKMNQIAPGYIPPGHERTPEMDQMVKKEALDVLIFRELAIQEAVRQGMKVPPEQIDETLKKIRAKAGSEDAFNKSLNMTGETEESLRKTIERDQLFDMIVKQEIFRKATEDPDPHSVENKKSEWEAELKKNAKIEIMLEEVEKKIKEESGKPKRD